MKVGEELELRSKIVMMSAHSEHEEWKKAEELGVELASKPITDKKLSNILMSQENV